MRGHLFCRDATEADISALLRVTLSLWVALHILQRPHRRSCTVHGSTATHSVLSVVSSLSYASPLSRVLLLSAAGSRSRLASFVSETPLLSTTESPPPVRTQRSSSPGGDPTASVLALRRLARHGRATRRNRLCHGMGLVCPVLHHLESSRTGKGVWRRSLWDGLGPPGHLQPGLAISLSASVDGLTCAQGVAGGPRVLKFCLAVLHRMVFASWRVGRWIKRVSEFAYGTIAIDGCLTS